MEYIEYIHEKSLTPMEYIEYIHEKSLSQKSRVRLPLWRTEHAQQERT